MEYNRYRSGAIGSTRGGDRTIVSGGKMADLISTVKEFYAAFSRGDIATILASVADDVSWEYEAPAEILSSGTRHSRKEVAEYFSAIGRQAVDHNLEMTEFLSTDMPSRPLDGIKRRLSLPASALILLWHITSSFATGR